MPEMFTALSVTQPLAPARHHALNGVITQELCFCQFLRHQRTYWSVPGKTRRSYAHPLAEWQAIMLGHYRLTVTCVLLTHMSLKPHVSQLPPPSLHRS